MKYRFDIKLTGYRTVEVEADNMEEAEERAMDKFWGEMPKHWYLADASTELNILDITT